MMNDEPRDQAEWQVMEEAFKRAQAYQIPIMALTFLGIVPSLFILTPLVIQVLRGGGPLDYLRLAGGLTALALPFVLNGIIQNHLLETAAGFLKDFHQLPGDSTAREIVNDRVFGPSFFGAIQVKQAGIQEQLLPLALIGGPAKLKIHPGCVVYIEEMQRFSKVTGQGTFFLGLDQSIRTVIHTAPQKLDFSVEAWTKDGIRVKLKAEGVCRIGLPGASNEMFPFDPEASRKAIEDSFFSGKDGSDWASNALGKTRGVLEEYISTRYLDQVFLPDKDASAPILTTQTRQDLLAKVNGRLEKFGMRMDYMNFPGIELPEKINTERIRLWGTGHKSYQTVTESKVKAYQLRSEKKALADMVHDLVMTLTNGLDRLESTDLTKEVLTSIYEVINRAMREPHRRYYSDRGTTPDGIEPPDIGFGDREET